MKPVDALFDVSRDQHADNQLDLTSLKVRLSRVMSQTTITGGSATEVLAQLLVVLAEAEIITDETGFRWLYDTVALSDSASRV